MVTLTVTEAGYLRGADGGLDRDPRRCAGRPRGAAPRPDRRGAHRAGAAGRRARRPPPGRRRAAHVVSVRQPARQRRGRCPRGRRPGRAGRPGLADWIDATRVVRHHMVDRITPRPHRTTTARGARRDRRATTARRWSPSRSASGCSAATSPAGGRAGRTPAPRFVDDIDAVRAAQAVAAQRRPLAARLRRRVRGHATVAEAIADDGVPRLARAVVGRGARRT